MLYHTTKNFTIPHPNLIKLALPYHKKLYHTTSQFNQNSGNYRYFTGKSQSLACLGARSGCLEHLRLSRGRLKSSRPARLSREGSGCLGRFRLSRAVSSYLEPPGYLERAQVVSSISGHLEMCFTPTRRHHRQKPTFTFKRTVYDA